MGTAAGRPRRSSKTLLRLEIKHLKAASWQWGFSNKSHLVCHLPSTSIQKDPSALSQLSKVSLTPGRPMDAIPPPGAYGLLIKPSLYPPALTWWGLLCAEHAVPCLFSSSKQHCCAAATNVLGLLSSRSQGSRVLG